MRGGDEGEKYDNTQRTHRCCVVGLHLLGRAHPHILRQENSRKG